jgi:hypothetical protein
MVFKSTIIATTIAGLMAMCNLQLAVAEPVKARALTERATPRPSYYDLYANEQPEDTDFELVDDDDNVITFGKRDFTLTKRSGSCSKTYKGRTLI